MKVIFDLIILFLYDVLYDIFLRPEHILHFVVLPQLNNVPGDGDLLTLT
jgi:hypothetical protein